MFIGVAQQVERLPEKEEGTGSTPVADTGLVPNGSGLQTVDWFHTRYRIWSTGSNPGLNAASTCTGPTCVHEVSGSLLLSQGGRAGSSPAGRTVTAPHHRGLQTCCLVTALPRKQCRPVRIRHPPPSPEDRWEDVFLARVTCAVTPYLKWPWAFGRGGKPSPHRCRRRLRGLASTNRGVLPGEQCGSNPHAEGSTPSTLADRAAEWTGMVPAGFHVPSDAGSIPASATHALSGAFQGSRGPAATTPASHAGNDGSIPSGITRSAGATGQHTSLVRRRAGFDSRADLWLRAARPGERRRRRKAEIGVRLPGGPLSCPVLSYPVGEMEIISRFEREVPGSSPGRGTVMHGVNGVSSKHATL